MQAKELAGLLTDDDRVRRAFEDAAARWTDNREEFITNLDKIRRNDLSDIEPVSRIRSAIGRKLNDVTSDWLEKAWQAVPLPMDIKTMEEEKPTQAKVDTISEWIKSASPGDVRKFGEEALLGQNDLVTIEFFERASAASRAVGRIDTGGTAKGTAFFVGENIILTNNHVLFSKEIAAGSTLMMNAEENLIGPNLSQEEFSLDPDTFFYTDAGLDFTLVATRERSHRKTPASEFGHLPLLRAEGKIVIGKNVNVVQFPDGQNKLVSFRFGVLVTLPEKGDDSFCYYTANTKQGSSGAPVFNDSWEVIALHHHAVPKQDVNGNILDKNNKQISLENARQNIDQVKWEANEGTRISRLIASFEKARLETPDMEETRAALLSLWDS